MATLPIAEGFDYWDPAQEEPGYDSETVSGRRKFRGRGFTKWRISCGWRNLEKAEANEILDFLEARGQEEIFQVKNRPDGRGVADREIGRSAFTDHLVNPGQVNTATSLVGRIDTGEVILVPTGHTFHRKPVVEVLTTHIAFPGVIGADVPDNRPIVSIDHLLPVRRVGEVDSKFRRGGTWDINIELLEELFD